MTVYESKQLNKAVTLFMRDKNPDGSDGWEDAMGILSDMQIAHCRKIKRIETKEVSKWK